MIGTLFADRYKVHGKLGEGGYGWVWAATDTYLRLEVALKTFRPGTPSIHVYSEARALTALEGEHVLRVYNADTHLDIPYIAAEVARGGTTETYLKRHTAGARPDRVVTWIRQGLIGLGACHDRGLVHRDIKPDNIFLDSEDRALLGDFGFVHAVAADGTVPAQGSPLTMAPEMWADGAGGFTADVYSMGVSAFRLLTGAWPITAPTRGELQPLVVAGAATRIRDLAPHISRRLASRVERAMKRDPAERYRSWREMHEDLAQHGVVGRVWERIRPHTGHVACWVERAPAGTTAHAVCSGKDGADSYWIEARRATGSGSRVRRHCHASVPGRRHALMLRTIFDAL